VGSPTLTSSPDAASLPAGRPLILQPSRRRFTERQEDAWPRNKTRIWTGSSELAYEFLGSFPGL